MENACDIGDLDSNAAWHKPPLIPSPGANAASAWGPPHGLVVAAKPSFSTTAQLQGALALLHRPRRCLKGRTAGAVFHEDAQRLRWTLRQRQTIFRLLLHRFGAMIGKTTNGTRLRPATTWRITVEAWLRCQGLITVRQNQKLNVSTTFPKCWSHN